MFHIHLSSKKSSNSLAATRESLQSYYAKEAGISVATIYSDQKVIIPRDVASMIVFFHEIRSIRHLPYFLLLRLIYIFKFPSCSMSFVYDCHDLHSFQRIYSNLQKRIKFSSSPFILFLFASVKFLARSFAESCFYAACDAYLFVSPSHRDFQRSNYRVLIRPQKSHVFYSLSASYLSDTVNQTYSSENFDKLADYYIAMLINAFSVAYFGVIDSRRFPHESFSSLLGLDGLNSFDIFAPSAQYHSWIDKFQQDFSSSLPTRRLINYHGPYDSTDINSVKNLLPSFCFSILPPLCVEDQHVAKAALPNKLFLSLKLSLPLLVHYDWLSIREIFSQSIVASPIDNYYLLFPSLKTSQTLSSLVVFNGNVLRNLS